MIRNHLFIFCDVGRQRKISKSLPGVWDGDRTVKKGFPVFRTGTGKSKSIPAFLGREREIQKSFPFVSEWENHAFSLGNILEQEIPLMHVARVFLNIYFFE